jgi:hypothetical protein
VYSSLGYSRPLHRRLWYWLTTFPLFLSFLFANLFSITFLYFFSISTFLPYINLFVSIFIQFYANNNLHVSTLYIYVPDQIRIWGRGSRRGRTRRPLRKGLAWLDWQSLDVKYVILTLCSFDSTLHCNEYSYPGQRPVGGPGAKLSGGSWELENIGPLFWTKID